VKRSKKYLEKGKRRESREIMNQTLGREKSRLQGQGRLTRRWQHGKKRQQKREKKEKYVWKKW